jgi:hypothetical protein
VGHIEIREAQGVRRWVISRFATRYLCRPISLDDSSRESSDVNSGQAIQRQAIRREAILTCSNFTKFQLRASDRTQI